MSFARSVEGCDLVAALTVGGFRIARRERGLALLVRGVDAVVVPEDRLLGPERVRALVERAGITEQELVTWLGVGESRPAARGASRSGFHRRVDTERSVDDVVKNARDASARAGVLHEGTNAVLRASRAAIDEVVTHVMPDEERVRTTRIALERWHEAMRERVPDDSSEDR